MRSLSTLQPCLCLWMAACCVACAQYQHWPTREVGGWTRIEVHLHLVRCQSTRFPLKVAWAFDRFAGATSVLAGRTYGKGGTDGGGRFDILVPSSSYADDFDKSPSLEIWARFHGVWRIVFSGVYYVGIGHVIQAYLDGAVRPAGVRVLVSNAQGRPIEHACARLVLGSGGGGPDPMSRPSYTDDRGQLMTRPLFYDGYWLDVSAPGYAPVRTFLPSQFGESSPVCSVTLERARVVLVDAMDLTGDAVSNAVLRLRYANVRSNIPSEWHCQPVAGSTYALIVPRKEASIVSVSAPGLVSDDVKIEPGVRKVKIILQRYVSGEPTR